MDQSEVARLREQIIREYEATQRVFTDFMQTGRHAFIEKRQENIGAYFEELSKFMPQEEAIVIVIEAMNAAQSERPSSGSTS